MADIGVRDDCVAVDGVRCALGIDFDRDDFSAGEVDFGRIAVDGDVDSALFEFGFHLMDQLVGAPLKRKNAFGHEVGKNDAVADGRVFERAAVGVGDRLHEEADDVFAAGEKFVEELAGGGGLVVIKIHAACSIEKRDDFFFGQLEFLDELIRKIFARKTGPHREHGVVEADAVELDDRVGDFLRPVAAARFDHAKRKPVEGDVKDVSAGALEPGGHSAQLVVLFEQQHATALASKDVGRGEAGEAGADDDDVVGVLSVFEEVFGHGERRLRAEGLKAETWHFSKIAMAGIVGEVCVGEALGESGEA